MLSSFFSGISGLLANSTAINVVSNNIANVNTVGYKGSVANFQDVLYQNINGASGTSQVGRGTALSSVDTNFAAGSLETTTSGTDLAIGGKGFFIVRSSDSQSVYYTRAGNFGFDADGNLVDPNNYILQGRQIDRTTGTPVGVDGDITISQAPSEPRATADIDMNVNLQSDSAWSGTPGTLTTVSGTPAATGVTVTDGMYPPTGAYTLAYNAATGNLTVTAAIADLDGPTGATISQTLPIAAGQTYEFSDLGITVTTAPTATFPAASSSQTINIDGFSATDPATTSNYSSSVTAYDSMGQAHIVNVYFRKASEDTATGQSTWEWIAELDAADSATNVNTMAGWGSLVFNNNGVLVSGGTAQTVDFDFSQGAAQNQMVDLVFGPTTGGTTTQYPISSTTNYQTQDGYPPGVLQSVSVSAEGILSGTYSNGQILDLYQITLANFNNANGLYKEGSNLYSETLASGVAYTNSPGEGGLGKISANSLEQSNVDLATEFVKMIIAQRGFQANSKVITTTDEILQELMTLKR
jgi:flagellar hook protein FlgE